MSKYINNNTIIADIGSGNGYYSFKLLQNFSLKKIYCLDRSNKALLKLKKNGEKLGFSNKIKLLCCDIEKISLSNNSVDIVMCNTLLHEFTYPSQVIRGMLKILKTGGIIVVIDFKNTRLGKFVGKGYTKKAHGAFSLIEFENLFKIFDISTLVSMEKRHWVIYIGKKH